MIDTLVIGIGDPLRGDDGAGPAVIDRLGQTPLPASVTLARQWGEGSGLMMSWQGWERVILVDATISGSPAGTVQRFDADCLPARGTFPYSTHRFGVAEGVALAAALGDLPGELQIFGIEGTVFTPGAGLSPAVSEAVDEVVERILSLLGR